MLGGVGSAGEMPALTRLGVYLPQMIPVFVAPLAFP